MPIILDLCGGTGSWSKPYADAGYEVYVIDPLADGSDVRLFERTRHPVHGILAAPPCTHLSGSGARWWAAKGEGALLEAMSVVDACLRIIMVHNPAWWVLENPVGRLSRYLGPPKMYFNPCEYAGYLENPDDDAYTKRTCLWGDFTVPSRRSVNPVLGSKMHLLPPSEDRWRLRSMTPQGFARAFFESNP